jgi:hypothetical protein
MWPEASHIAIRTLQQLGSWILKRSKELIKRLRKPPSRSVRVRRERSIELKVTDEYFVEDIGVSNSFNTTKEFEQVVKSLSKLQ